MQFVRYSRYLYPLTVQSVAKCRVNTSVWVPGNAVASKLLASSLLVECKSMQACVATLHPSPENLDLEFNVSAYGGYAWRCR